ATMVDNGPLQRREQLLTVLEDAARYPRSVVTGDFNSPKVPAVALERGYTWPTRKIGRTNALWAMDHVLLRGVALDGAGAFGSVRDTVDASDHKPVWARLRVREDDTPRT